MILLVALVISSLAGKTADRKVGLFWKISVVILFFIALDEFTQLHERLIDPINELLNTHFLFSWIWIYVPLFLVCAGILFPLFRKLSPPWRKLIYISVALYLFGAVVIETWNGFYIKTFSDIFIYKQLTIIEEFFEIFAFLYLLSGLLKLSKSIPAEQAAEEKT